ncbi:hypothetical protein ACV229_15515 [Burkholderia sp. MR1-5-21]
MNTQKNWKNVLLAGALSAGFAMSAQAATYTPQEEANVKLVADFFAALDGADAHGDMKQRIRSVAEKYVRVDYIQHMEIGKKFGQGREGLIRLFEQSPPMSAPGAGAPPAGMASGPGMTPPAGAPPQAGMAPPPGKGAMPAPPAPQVLALVANGDIVIRVSSRTMPARPGAESSPSFMFDMFRIKDGQLAEHWDGSSNAGMGPPPSTPTPGR